MKIYKQNCGICNKYYEGYGKYYCSSKCQPRNYPTGVKGEKHGNWKGVEASYFAFHQWLRTHFGNANKCENSTCFYPRKNAARSIVKAPKRFDWALIKGKEYDHKRENFIQLCPSCHKKYDMNLITI